MRGLSRLGLLNCFLVVCTGCNSLTRLNDLTFRADAGAACEGSDCCADECELSAKRCTNGSEQTCANYDGDSCLEWGGESACGALGCAAEGCRVLPPDCTPPEGSTCSVLPSNCGCDPGMTCQIDLSTGHGSCLPLGTVPTHGTCETSADCAAGNLCLPIISGELGVCYPYCSEEVGCARGTCEQLALSDVSLSACFAGCDPVDPRRTDATFTACGPGVYCAPSVSGVGEIALCTGPAAPRGKGEPCDGGEFEIFECGPGLACMNDVCTPWCRSSADCVGAPYPGCVGKGGYLAGPGDAIGYCMGDKP